MNTLAWICIVLFALSTLISLLLKEWGKAMGWFCATIWVANWMHK